MAKVYGVTMQKGGVGKTTVACNLAWAARDRGQSVAVIDLDPQGHAGLMLSRNPVMDEQREGGAQQIFGEEAPVFAKTPTGVDLLHGHEWLIEVELEDGIHERTVALRERVRRLPYDVIILDTPPAPGILQLAALFWAHLVVIPMEPATLSMGGLRRVVEKMEPARTVNPGLTARIVLNRALSVSAEQRQHRETVETHFPGLVLAEFRSRVAVMESLERGQPVWEHRKDKALGEEWRTFCNNALDTVK